MSTSVSERILFINKDSTNSGFLDYSTYLPFLGSNYIKNVQKSLCITQYT